ncbi:hypothetical protein HL033_04335 [Neoehrlichia mikurensis]|uniref:Phage tail protein n=1 Tax=Neoehrlichia mikurensis TaxID=89586 RepID=A0A9Q9BZP4_9RICK|nr:phage tail tube protein [Neoehrlichia mikurensis]QXK91942.1 hypothetical protein IAH97_04330 [Neoehrlichia mikurensis]QXK93155.1 hypothetical protein HUN61_04325 [Neoehrlichia mikurensis]QXK93635.1 hypothetical protein HL033_04335 [Neoehrlichia mikurensis]UTO55410.1 phage tail protein [Neoehrlichia mikurensis]UTO56329.1 phage tail protein [Neoehrlichia mikurensis]
MTVFFKFKDLEGNFILLKNIKSVRLTLRNKGDDIKNIYSIGWKNILENSGDKYIVIKISGILDYSFADQLLRQYSFANSIVESELIFYDKEKILIKCIIELYERYYEVNKFDNFNVTLISTSKVIYI